MNNPNTKISCGIVLLLSLTIVSCGGGNSGGGGGGNGGGGNGGGGPTAPLTDRDLELIEPETLGTFSASADNGGIIRYSNKEDAPPTIMLFQEYIMQLKLITTNHTLLKLFSEIISLSILLYSANQILKPEMKN